MQKRKHIFHTNPTLSFPLILLLGCLSLGLVNTQTPDSFNCYDFLAPADSKHACIRVPFVLLSEAQRAFMIPHDGLFESSGAFSLGISDHDLE